MSYLLFTLPVKLLNSSQSNMKGNECFMAEKTVALKVDVDTYAGTRDGVPNLLADMAGFGVKGTFYFSMGPDNSGKAIRRIFTRPGFLKKMLRTKAPAAYGIKTMLYGTLLPAPMIASCFPDLLRETEKAGHEVGIHCWDHVKWHDYLPSFPKGEAEMEMRKASELFEKILGHSATTTAAPGWSVSPDSLEVQDAMRLAYCSDGRGTHPFYPVMGGQRFQTLQLPTTLPTADEILGENGITPDNIHEFYCNKLTDELNVLTIHAELEGNAIRPSFVRLLERFRSEGVRCITLGEAAAGITSAPACLLFMGEIEGRAGKVAIQGNPLP
jgi:peptidoglycan/xylan/chitin deacetylase (PgdA/CDA1 family)